MATVLAAINRVLTEYGAASAADNLKGHPLADFIRNEARDAVASHVPDTRDIAVKGSAGQGNWAAIPWIALFHNLITGTATHGYYPVLLFDPHDQIAYLSLNQGTTAIQAEFGREYVEVLSTRAELIRRKIPEALVRFPETEITLHGNGTLPAGYEAGHACGRSYTLTNLPSEEALAADIADMINFYRTLVFRGGIDAVYDSPDEGGPGDDSTILEKRQYRMHRRIERNPVAAAKAKKHHGAHCQACRISFGEVYGSLGNGYIEAHHLRPLSALKEGEVTTYDVATDFAVLCANCHRMIHRLEDVSDVAKLKALLAKQTKPSAMLSSARR